MGLVGVLLVVVTSHITVVSTDHVIEVVVHSVIPSFGLPTLHMALSALLKINFFLDRLVVVLTVNILKITSLVHQGWRLVYRSYLLKGLIIISIECVFWFSVSPMG